MLLDDKLLGFTFLGTVAHLWYGACQMCSVIPALRAGLILSDPDGSLGQDRKRAQEDGRRSAGSEEGFTCPVSCLHSSG